MCKASGKCFLKLIFFPTCLFVPFTVLSHRLTRLDRFTVAIHNSRNNGGNNELLKLLNTGGNTVFI